MKEVQLTQGYVALVDDEDFESVSKHCWHIRKSSNGRTVYARAYLQPSAVSKKQTAMHQYLTGKVDMDHKDGNGLNNQRSNLRVATRSQQVANGSLRNTNTSGFKGVSWHKQVNLWRAYIVVGAKQKHLGCYTSKEEAAKAYDVAALQIFGEFAKLNYPSPA